MNPIKDPEHRELIYRVVVSQFAPYIGQEDAERVRLFGE